MDGDDKKTAQGETEAGWQYRPGPGQSVGTQPAELTEPPASTSGDDGTVEWSASEFVAHDKSFGWYAAFTLGALLIIAGLYLATRDMFSTGVAVVMAAILLVAASRKPRVVTYRLDRNGLTIGKKFYPYGAYKSFRMPDDGPFTSVYLVPMKRFDFPVGAYLAPDSQDKALELLSAHLPLEHSKPGLVDDLMKQLRF
jgi:hypothetical protein